MKYFILVIICVIFLSVACDYTPSKEDSRYRINVGHKQYLTREYTMTDCGICFTATYYVNAMERSNDKVCSTEWTIVEEN